MYVEFGKWLKNKIKIWYNKEINIYFIPKSSSSAIHNKIWKVEIYINNRDTNTVPDNNNDIYFNAKLGTFL